MLTTDSTVAPGRPRGTLPLRLLVGVTGHRVLADEGRVAAAVRALLGELRRLAAPGPATQVILDVISPLAEGADRIVASVTLESAAARLHAVLPLPAADYEADFSTAQSREMFRGLLSRATRVTRPAAAGERAAAYERAGRLVVDSCDVLLAIWDGQPTAGRGGTAEIVEYAGRVGRPVLRVSPDGQFPPANQVSDSCGLPGTLARLDTFNAERVDDATARRAESAALTVILRSDDAAGNPEAPAPADLVAAYARADLLALRYQRRHRRAGVALHLLAAAAVAAATLQALFAPDLVVLAWVEAACIAVVLAVYALGTRGRWHDRWLDYRRLAERCRTALYLSIAGLDPAILAAPAAEPEWAEDWVDAAFRGLVRALPGPRPGEIRDIPWAASWLADRWIDRQREYHAAVARSHAARHRRLFVAGMALFACTCAAALLHAAPGVPHDAHRVLWFAAIVLPAAGGALAAIRTQRDDERTAARSADLARHLGRVGARTRQASDGPELEILALEAADAMARENDDWRALVRAHPLEPPA